MSPDSPQMPSAGVLRRLAAMLYDGLLLLAVLFIATALLLPLTHGEAVHAGNPLFSTYLLFVTFLFFAWFWTHGGQTLGMRAWRLRVERRDGRAVGWWHALLRFLTALPAWVVIMLGLGRWTVGTQGHPEGILGLVYNLPAWALLGAGALWLVIDNWRDSWRDRFSETRVVLLPKRARTPAGGTAASS